ncbi:hypothetical protein DFH28DRAFT_993654 [Melampsora americana]|nr:hypothetical protein DFH28DRAFT_993654 [Melampsora americana]
MVHTRSKRPIASNLANTSSSSTTRSKKKQKKSQSNNHQSQPRATQSSARSRSHSPSSRSDNLPNPQDDTIPDITQQESRVNPTNENNNKQSDKVFCSRFPGLELKTFEDKLDEWTITQLQDAIVKQGSRRSKAHKDIKDLVKLLRLEFEERILMVALMADVPEVVIWNLMGFGKNKMKANPWIRFLSFCVKCLGNKLPERDDKEEWVSRNQRMAVNWNGLTKDEKDVFCDPYFFALAGLPDYNTIKTELDENDSNMDNDAVNVQHFDSSTVAPTVHKLSEEEKQKYQPLFERLVNVEKVHLSHGKPEPTPSIASLQKQSLLAVRKAHQDIAYYLTASSCGGVNGWSQTFSNEIDFADWALKVTHLPTMFTNYVHGKDAVKQIEAKVAQPSDEQRHKLGELLNSLVDTHVPGCIFPKSRDPVGVMKKKGWKIKILQKEDSLLKSEDLLIGHWKVTGTVVQAWTQDVLNK